MSIHHYQISFHHSVPSWDIDYYTDSLEELQGDWKNQMDPLCDPLRPTGTTYEIKQVD